MKTLIAVLAIATSSFALANQNLCQIKQQNAAMYQLAQEEGQPVTKVSVEGFQYGAWTEAVGNNTGSDNVTVSVPGRIVDHIVKKTYSVGAKQIGRSDDCTILSVKLVK